VSIDNDRNPKRLEKYAAGGARERGNVDAKVVRELDEEMPDAACRTVHQHPLARLRLEPLDDLERRSPGEWERRGLERRQRRWATRDEGRIGDDLLCV
jgi:hypothetical protein